MTDTPPLHMTDPVQPHDRDVEVPGIGTSGDENLAKRPCEELMPKDANTNENHSQGDNPTYTLPPFADGKDLRNRG